MKFNESLHPVTIGACGEYIVAVDLANRCSCDLVAIRDGVLYRVEVKVGMKWVPSKIDKPKYDILARVAEIGERSFIFYDGGPEDIQEEITI